MSHVSRASKGPKLWNLTLFVGWYTYATVWPTNMEKLKQSAFLIGKSHRTTWVILDNPGSSYTPQFVESQHGLCLTLFFLQQFSKGFFLIAALKGGCNSSRCSWSLPFFLCLSLRPWGLHQNQSNRRNCRWFCMFMFWPWWIMSMSLGTLFLLVQHL